MKSRIIILFVLLSLYGLGQSVPNTTTFTISTISPSSISTGATITITGNINIELSANDPIISGS